MEPASPETPRHSKWRRLPRPSLCFVLFASSLLIFIIVIIILFSPLTEPKAATYITVPPQLTASRIDTHYGWSKPKATIKSTRKTEVPPQTLRSIMEGSPLRKWLPSQSSIGGFQPMLIVGAMCSILGIACCWPGRPAFSLAAAASTGAGRKSAPRSGFNPRHPSAPLADTKKALEIANTHPRDRLVRFDPTKRSHQYMSPAGQWTKASASVTAFVYSLFPEFDAEKVISGMMESPKWPFEKYVDPESGQAFTKQQIKKMWKDSGKESATRGNYVHQMIEKDLNAAPVDEELPELRQSRRFRSAVLLPRAIRPVRTEMAIFDEDLDLAGTVDFLGQAPDGTFHICEWKTSGDYEGKATEVYPTTASALWPAEHLPNNNAVKHTLQINLYARIIERKYGLRVAGLWLCALHPDRSTPYAVQVPFLDKEMDCLVALRRLDVIAAWRTGKPVSLQHTEALELLTQQGDPSVRDFHAALDAARASAVDFYRCDDDVRRYEMLVAQSQDWFRHHYIPDEGEEAPLPRSTA